MDIANEANRSRPPKGRAQEVTQRPFLSGHTGRWAAAAFLETEKNFNRLMGYRDLWALKAILQGEHLKARQAIA